MVVKANVGLIVSFRNLTNVITGPKAALFYGIWGVLPFVAFPIYMGITGKNIPQLIYANLTYGGGIVSFLGAVRWGLAIPNSKEKTLKPSFHTLGWAVTPVSVAWLALLTSSYNGSLMIIGTFLACIFQDAYSAEYPAWYKSFRIIFSSFAVLSLGANLLMYHSIMN
ncbi:transmembrane protein 69-like [Daphnia carinata]|uniref:transmembrane protein 69-like n=1 Tax=Daphnia carinata TaxID=120202 RepID=UPI00257A4607|nr:transmembrane protein 69-like [Daphnia carinata]